MRKNTANQKVGAQLVSATDGSAFTGPVTVYITGNAGAQAVGSVGAGACTHEGNGYHTYSPAQAETNYDLVAFTFIGAGAVPVTIQIYTNTPQTGDAFARLVSAGVAVVSPVSPQGTRLTIVRGDDYYDADGRALEWTSALWPDLTGATILLTLRNPGRAIHAAGVVVTPTGTAKVRVELTNAHTRALKVGEDVINFDVQATLASEHVVTLAAGTVTVIEA